MFISENLYAIRKNINFTLKRHFISCSYRKSRTGWSVFECNIFTRQSVYLGFCSIPKNVVYVFKIHVHNLIIMSSTTDQFVTAPKPKYYIVMKAQEFDYQSVCHCSKTDNLSTAAKESFDYQSVCHCSKTGYTIHELRHSLTTSQFVTAPKLPYRALPRLPKFDYQSVCHCSKTSTSYISRISFFR